MLSNDLAAIGATQNAALNGGMFDVLRCHLGGDAASILQASKPVKHYLGKVRCFFETRGFVECLRAFRGARPAIEAISARRSADSFSARAFPPRLANSRRVISDIQASIA